MLNYGGAAANAPLLDDVSGEAPQASGGQQGAFTKPADADGVTGADAEPDGRTTGAADGDAG
ncbi:hypothetical protein IE994_24420 [Enterobacter hormaechei]|nr:hypothetical protein [Enterobacter hormaechei]